MSSIRYLVASVLTTALVSNVAQPATLVDYLYSYLYVAITINRREHVHLIRIILKMLQQANDAYRFNMGIDNRGQPMFELIPGKYYLYPPAKYGLGTITIEMSETTLTLYVRRGLLTSLKTMACRLKLYLKYLVQNAMKHDSVLAIYLNNHEEWKTQLSVYHVKILKLPRICLN